MIDMTQGDICHTEIITKNVDAAKDFYQNSFGWKMNVMGPEMNNYVMFETPNGSTGGIRTPMEGEQPGVLSYILVDDIDAETNRITKAGAKVVMPKTEVPGMGFMVVAVTPAGIATGIWQNTGK